MTAIAQSTLVNTSNTWIRCSDNTVVDGMTVNISIASTNPDISMARIDVAITTDPLGPAPKDLIESYSAVVRGTPLLRTGEPFKEGEALYVRSEQTGVAVRVSGYNRL